MSDHDGDRPHKRRRRNSSLLSPRSESCDDERRTLKRLRDNPSQYLNPREWDLSGWEHRSMRRRDRKSTSPRRGRETDDRRVRKKRTQSREPYRDQEYRSHRDREQDQSDVSWNEHYRYSDRHRDRHRDHDRNRKRNGTWQDAEQQSHRSTSPEPYKRSKAPLPSQNDTYTARKESGSASEMPIEKQKPNFGLTGKLAAASNTIQTANQTIVLKYHEPPEARKPSGKDQWRLYIFKGDEILDTVELSEQSCWLIGREVAVADFPIEHPSCSKQHAVIQFRYLEKRNEFGDKIGKVKPYLIDLESANGTSLNEDRIPAAKYVELRDKDVLKFGHSSREYVLQLPASGNKSTS